MRNLLIILIFTIKQSLKKRSFWISNIIIALIILISFMCFGSSISSIGSDLSMQIADLEIEDITLDAIISIIISFLLFFAIYFYGHSIASSISNEKSSRVIEILMTSAKPYQIILGKTFGMGLLGILQLLFLCFITSFSYHSFIASNLDFVSIFMQSFSISSSNIIIFFLYFILGYLLYAFSNTIIGATISRSEDLQISSIPLSFLSLISFFLAIFTITSPQDSLSTFVSYFPFSSAFSMPAKFLIGINSINEVIVSLLILLIFVILLAFLSIRIYSVLILNYGNRTKLKDLFYLILKIK